MNLDKRFKILFEEHRIIERRIKKHFIKKSNLFEVVFENPDLLLFS